MKTLEEIKDEVAKESGFVSWDNLVFIHAGFIQVVRPYNDEATRRFAIEVAKEALRNAAENVELKESIPHSAIYDTIDKESIISESNIPKL